jgi:signal transduction histidine kinase
MDGEAAGTIVGERVLVPAARAQAGEATPFLSTAPASPAQHRITAAFFAVSLAGLLAAAPFARVPLPPQPALIGIHEALLVAFDAITALLLYGEFLGLRSRGLLVLTCGYGFSAMLTAAHLLAFPGLFAPAGLLGAGPQGTAWLYWFWHGGFLLAVVLHTLPRGTVRAPLAAVLPGAALATVLLAGGLVVLATRGARYLPDLMADWRDFGPLDIAPALAALALGSLALAALWRVRPRTVLHLSLMAVAWASMLDFVLASLFANSRYQLGFYAARVFGVVAASLMLVVLVTNINRLYRRAVAAARAAEAANRAKDRFLATASHDLRQPLQTLALLHGTLRRMVSDPGAAPVVAGEGRAIATMSELLEALLDIGRLDSGRMEPRFAELDLDELFGRLEGEFAGLAKAKGLTLVVAKGGGAARTVRTDATLLGQVLRNLLGNALRYTRVGMVGLSSAREGGRVRIDVADTGIGIAPEALGQIFEEFYQVGVPPGTTREGYGLGLAWVRRAARVLGAEVRVRSRPGEGSVFSVLLPGEPGDGAPAPAGTNTGREGRT